MKMTKSIHFTVTGKNIITLAGAGISTSANIPDFRSEDGFYAQIKQKFKLPYPEVIFDIEFVAL
jgi:NAD-dependent SIR2 family protein deacetylase